MHKILFGLLLFLLVGCAARRNQQARIEGYRQTVAAQADVTRTREAAIMLVEESAAYAQQYPTDTLTATYLFRAADVARGLERYEQALELWEQFRTSFPDHPNAPEALFYQGFTADTGMANFELARTHYEDFLARYPNHVLSTQVVQLLKVMGTTNQELIRRYGQ